LCVRADGVRVEEIKKLWREVNPTTEISIENNYSIFLERNGKAFEIMGLLSIFSIMSIFITCFGIFGVTVYSVKQRMKEIGIRKINGASTLRILWMLNKSFIFQLIASWVTAIPITWMFLGNILSQFSEHIDLTFSIMVLSGIIVAFVTLLTINVNSYIAASSNPIKFIKNE
jgi:Predicted permease.